MILGLGSDILEVQRMEAALERRGGALAMRLLALEEHVEWEGTAEPGRFLAKRFAAKEAVLKALGTGLRDGLRWRDICIEHDRRGKPWVRLRGAARRQLEMLGGRRCWVSLSDEKAYVLAFAIVEGS
jgi:holo-[acyl-carrier protein] synthase